MKSRFFILTTVALGIAASTIRCGSNASHRNTDSLPTASSHVPQSNPGTPDANTTMVVDANTIAVVDANVLTVADANTTVTRAKGAPVVMQLMEAVDGGYTYSVAQTDLGTPTRTSQATAVPSNDPNDPPLVGAPNVVTFTWQTQQVPAGTYPLTFTEARPFDTSDAQSFTVTVVLMP